VATLMATYTLQTLGEPALAEGNVIILNGERMGVVEACSGLGMLLLFFALATGCALLVRRSLVERVLIVASAAPIAVLSNVIRITATALLLGQVNSEEAKVWIHDVTGWLMMPLALGMLGLELWVFSRSVVEVPAEGTGAPAEWAGPSPWPKAVPEAARK
jgi:exosortase